MKKNNLKNIITLKKEQFYYSEYNTSIPTSYYKLSSASHTYGYLSKNLEMMKTSEQEQIYPLKHSEVFTC